VQKKNWNPGGDGPANVGSQRLLEIASRQDLHDRALWTPTATATGAQGASTALVGSYETVAAAILDYVDLGADLISIRGYDNLNDAIDYGRYLIPLVRQELEHRERTGVRGAVVRQDPLPADGERTGGLVASS
jgi:alkanesulfonate monooxygenase